MIGISSVGDSFARRLCARSLIARRSPPEEGKDRCQHVYRPLLPLRLRQCGFDQGQPEGHVHDTVQVDGGGQGGTGLLPTASLVLQPAQAEVAVGHEWAHAQLLGQSEDLAVVGFGLRGIRRLVPRRNVNTLATLRAIVAADCRH
jgi:hypothetical protein